MRCLVVADLHYALQQYDWVMDGRADFDVVIIAGDQLDQLAWSTAARRAW